jgi:hypothetical protein
MGGDEKQKPGGLESGEEERALDSSQRVLVGV